MANILQLRLFGITPSVYTGTGVRYLNAKREAHNPYSPHTIDLINKFQNAPVPYPTMHYSEQKCAHFCSEWCIVGYRTGAFWDLWGYSITIFVPVIFDQFTHSAQEPAFSLRRSPGVLIFPFHHSKCIIWLWQPGTRFTIRNDVKP